MNVYHTTLLRLTAALALVLALVGLTTPTARAASLTVTSTADSGAGSLRQAIADAAAGDTINFNLSGCPCTITLASELAIGKNLTITGPGANQLAISGNNATRVFQVVSGAAATLDGLIISGGRPASGSNGGGILNNGTLAVSNSTFSGNNGGSFGGGIYNLGGAATVSNSTFSGNAASFGGGIVNDSGTLSVSNSTFSGNSAGIGGGIYSRSGSSTATVSNSTFSSNSAFSRGGGIFILSGTVTVSNSIVAGNTAPSDREMGSSGPITSGGYNLFGFNGNSGLFNVTTVSTDVIPTVGLSAILDTTLRNNGGLTQTLALVAGSPAINAGNTSLTTDQRGIARPQGSADDIGAFEFVPPPANSAPVATNDSFTTNEDTALTGNVITNTNPNGADSDPDGNPLTAVKVSDPAHGNVTLNANGSFTYTPAANYNGSDSFTYRANDGTVDSNVATVNLTIRAVNDAPTATNDSYSTNEDTALTISAPGVLTNDTDLDVNPLTAVKVSDPAHGTVTLNANGSFTYTPAANYNGSDSFTYRANDGTVDSNVATVNLTVNGVNDAPTATTDSYSTNEDTALTISAPGVLGNDSDADDNPLTAVKVSDPAHGTLTFNANGSFTYAPASNYNGPDSFTYKANDGTADSGVATVSITVNAVNDAPTASDDAYSTTAGMTLRVDAPGLLANDSDPDGTTLSASTLSDPAHGTLTLNADGSFAYQPAAGYAGADSFTYTASDGTVASNVATVRLNITKVFPMSDVLDSFDRANGKVGANWDGLTDQAFYKIASNKLDVQLGGPLVWKPAAYGTTQEAFVTLSTIDTKNPSQGLLLKVQSGNVPNAGAISVVYDAKAKAVRVSAARLERNGAWTLYPNQAAMFANGDVLGARAKANGTVEIYKNGTLIASVTLSAADQAFFNTKGGKIGIWTVAASNAVLDDFGGGNVAQ